MGPVARLARSRVSLRTRLMVRTATTRVVIVGRVRPQAVDLYAPSHPTHGMEKPANMKRREVDPAQRNGHAEHTLRFLALMDHTVWTDGHAEQTPWFLALREHVVSHLHASLGIICHFTLTTRTRVGGRTRGASPRCSSAGGAWAWTPRPTTRRWLPRPITITVLTKTHCLCRASWRRALPGTTSQPGAQKPQLHGGPIWLAQESISSNVSAQTF